MRDEDHHPNKKASNENMALETRMKGKQKDLSKIKHFNYGVFGHYLMKCLRKNEGDDKKKKGKQVAGVASSTKIDDLSRRLESEDFALISHFSQGTINELAWYVDSGASKHMTSSHDVFETRS